MTLLNDSRYGWDKPNDHTLRLSLLYSPKPDRGYVYQASQDYGHHVFTYSIIGHEGMLDAAKAVRRSDMLNSPLKTFFTDKHQGSLGNRFSFITTDNDIYQQAVETSGFFPVRPLENVYAGTDIADVMSEDSVFMPYMGDYYQVTSGWAQARTEWWNMLQRIGAGGNVADEVAVFVANANAAAGN